MKSLSVSSRSIAIVFIAAAGGAGAGGGEKFMASQGGTGLMAGAPHNRLFSRRRSSSRNTGVSIEEVPKPAFSRTRCWSGSVRAGFAEAMSTEWTAAPAAAFRPCHGPRSCRRNRRSRPGGPRMEEGRARDLRFDGLLRALLALQAGRGEPVRRAPGFRGILRGYRRAGRFCRVCGGAGTDPVQAAGQPQLRAGGAGRGHVGSRACREQDSAGAGLRGGWSAPA